MYVKWMQTASLWEICCDQIGSMSSSRSLIQSSLLCVTCLKKTTFSILYTQTYALLRQLIARCNNWRRIFLTDELWDFYETTTRLFSRSFDIFLVPATDSALKTSRWSAWFDTNVLRLYVHLPVTLVTGGTMIYKEINLHHRQANSFGLSRLCRIPRANTTSLLEFFGQKHTLRNNTSCWRHFRSQYLNVSGWREELNCYCI